MLNKTAITDSQVTAFFRRPVSYIAAAILAGSSALSAAQQLTKLEQEASFHIPAGSLEYALIQFSRQAEIQIVVSGPVAKFSVSAVEGRRNAREVLTTLLTSTGLTYTVVGETITVHGIAPISDPAAVSAPGKPAKGESGSAPRR